VPLRIQRYLTFRISTNKPFPIFDRRGRERTSAALDKRLLNGAPGQDALTVYRDKLLESGVPEGDIDDTVLLADMEVRSVTEEFWLEARRRAAESAHDDEQGQRKEWRALRIKMGLTRHEVRVLSQMLREFK